VINYKVHTEAARQPITLDEAKAHLRVTNTAEDDVITFMIKAATKWCERYSGYTFVNTVYQLNMDDFPPDDIIVLPKYPLAGVTSIKYYNDEDTQVTFDSDNYRVDTTSIPGRVEYVTSWPGVYDKINTIEILFTAGYGTDPADVPDDMKAAIKIMLGHLYEHRQEVVNYSPQEMPMGARAILGAYKIPVF